MHKYEFLPYRSDDSGLIGDVYRVDFPDNQIDIQNSIKNSKLDIVPRGSGTNTVGSCVPDNSIVIDMKKINYIRNLDRKELSIEVGPGIKINELNEKLKSLGFEFPIIAQSNSTIGGLIALNYLGIYGAYNRIKDWILELDIIDGRGEIRKIFRSDLSDICGMEGTTGIITSVKIKIIPLLEKSASIYQTDDINELITFSKRLKLDKDVLALRYYSSSISGYMNFPGKYNLIILFDSEKGRIKGINFFNLLNKIKKEKIILRKNNYKFSEDPIFDYNRLIKFIRYLEENNIPYIGDFTRNIIYPYFKNLSAKNETEKIIIKSAGIPGNNGIGIRRKHLIDPLRKKIIQRIKLRYDPFFRLNKGKLIDYFNENEIKENMKNIHNLNKKKIDNNIKEYESKSDSQINKTSDETKTGKTIAKDNLDNHNDEKEKDIINSVMFNNYQENNKKEENDNRRA